MPEGQAGYDAVDIDAKLGPRGARYQVKSRSPEKNRFVDPMGTVGGFSSLVFNAAILVLMDSDLQVYEVWLASVDKVRANLRQGRRDITVARFKQVGRSLSQVGNTDVRQPEVQSRTAVVCWQVVAYGKILSEPYDLVSRKGIPPVDKNWPGAVDIGEIQWRRGGNCPSPPREGSHRL